MRSPLQIVGHTIGIAVVSSMSFLWIDQEVLALLVNSEVIRTSAPDLAAFMATNIAIWAAFVLLFQLFQRRASTDRDSQSTRFGDDRNVNHHARSCCFSFSV